LPQVGTEVGGKVGGCNLLAINNLEIAADLADLTPPLQGILVLFPLIK